MTEIEKNSFDVLDDFKILCYDYILDKNSLIIY